MNRRLNILLLCFIATTCIVHAGRNDVIVQNLKMFVDETEFFIKAICYNPVPIGIRNQTADGGGGAGLCSPKLTPHDEWKSACYDSDYFDGSSDVADRWPPGPASWFESLWLRDFPHIKALGANTIRIYNANPTTREASLNPANGIPKPTGKDHIPFMDMAAANGLKVIFPLYGDATSIAQGTEAEQQQFIRWQIDEVGNHGALLMFTFGNELDLHGSPALVAKINSYINYARGYLLTRWNRVVPFTSAVVDLPFSYNTLVRELDVDIFTTNAGYRSFDFSDLWSGNSVTEGMFNLSCKHNKPVFIGEIGWLSLDNEADYLYPDWINQVWKDLVGHIDQGCIGGAFFEYSDELYSKEDPLQKNLGLVTVSVNQNSDEPNGFLPDIVAPKPIIYEALASGTYQGIPYNMNSDPFALIGRSATMLGSEQSICGPVLSSTSGTNTQAPIPSSTTGSAHTNSPTNPTNSPTNPTNSPTNPTNSPTNPTNSPFNPTNPPTNPTDTPNPNPTNSPTDTPNGTPAPTTDSATQAPTTDSATRAPTGDGTTPTLPPRTNDSSTVKCATLLYLTIFVTLLLL